MHERLGGIRQTLLGEARNCFRSGDRMTGKALLRDPIQGTIGFEPLAAGLGDPVRILRVMLSRRGNPAPRT